MQNQTDVFDRAINSTLVGNVSDVTSTSTVSTTMINKLPTTTISSTTLPPADHHTTATSIAFISLVVFGVACALIAKIVISHKKKRAELIGSARWRISASRQSASSSVSSGNGQSSATYLPMGRGGNNRSLNNQRQPLNSLDHPTPDRLDWERQFFDDSEATKEKKTMNFENLPLEMHCKIAEYLPLRDRFSLQKCTKALAAVHRKAHLYLDNARFMWFSGEDNTDPILFAVCFDDLELEFLTTRVHTAFERIRVTNNSRRSQKTAYLRNQDYADVSKQCFRDVFLNKNVSINSFTTNYMIDQSFFESADQINVRKIVFPSVEPSHRSNQRVDLWLNHVNPKMLETVIVYNQNEGNCIVGNSRVLRGVKRLSILLASDINDDLLLSLIATEIHIGHSQITVEGVNKLIKNWASREVPRGAEFEYAPENLTMFTLSRLVKNIENSAVFSDKAVVPVAPDRYLHISVRDLCVRVDCLRTE